MPIAQSRSPYPARTLVPAGADIRPPGRAVRQHSITVRWIEPFLTAAIACPQLNDAVRMAQDGYATPADIDTAMMLGCGYPRGPLQMLDDTGPALVPGVLSAIHACSGDPAFAPAPLLAEHAAATPFRS